MSLMLTYVAFPMEADLNIARICSKEWIHSLDMDDERVRRNVEDYFAEVECGDHPHRTDEEARTALLTIIDEFYNCLDGPGVDTLLHKDEYLYVTCRNLDEETYDCFTRYIILNEYFNPSD
jgi:hypothetical protein